MPGVIQAPARSCENCAHWLPCTLRQRLTELLGWYVYLDINDQEAARRIYAAVGEGCRQFSPKPEVQP